MAVCAPLAGARLLPVGSGRAGGWEVDSVCLRLRVVRGLRICDPFRAAGFFFLVAERHFELTCPCGVKQRGDVLLKRTDGKVMLYDCPSCGATLIGVSRDDRAPDGDNDDGHRMCGFVFGSTVDMGL